MRAQTQASPRLHHNQLSIFHPPSQQSMHPPPVTDAPAIQYQQQQQQPYDPYYLQHQQLQLQQQQQQSLGYNNQGDQDKKHIHTIFVSGLPDDVKPREIHNLFRRRLGFDNCQLKYTRGNQVVAFASFVNHQSAMAALNALNGVIFDPQTGATLHIELARSNSRKIFPSGSGAYVVIDQRQKASDAQDTLSNDGDGGSDEPSGDNPNSSNKGDLATAESDETRVDPDNAEPAANKQSGKTVAVKVQPCSTLFIANLGPNCTEEELKQVLTQYRGFHVLKLRARSGMPVAFAAFENKECATEAMQSLQGSMLPSSDRGGLHIEYARSKMRKV
ncbi:hypothetical protein NE237_026596 [Protea cynaroides]|uniref:RRM domain-containing protein n=1 Tax=Protea cynaroides TaxID=273540 RepID=A0A9Q0H7E3_9MAGN|nr:hypothetical protein NE237_026596 [Protea cynaroides]